MNKQELTEADIRTNKFIAPAILGSDGSKWNVMTQVREEVYFTRGRVIVRGETVKRGEAKKIDDVRSYTPGIRIDAKRQALDALDERRKRGAPDPEISEDDAALETTIEVDEALTSQSRHSLALGGYSPHGKLLVPLNRRDVRVVEGARLEIDSGRAQ